ncbi:DUF4388 domain-containing protein [bacterium]|nr:DUF4388 domain-containing protein [bacterium]
MLEGKIERQGFLDIIQLLTMSRKTGRLEVTGEVEGQLFFSNGDLLDCQTNKLVGDEAFIELFILVSGAFKFHEEGVNLSRRISKSLTDILMIASKQATEWDSARQELPFDEAALVLAPVDPEAAKDFQFGALGWAIISQINGRRSFPEIARILGKPKTKVAITIAELKKQGLVTTEDSESALLRTVFRKTSDVIYRLIINRVKPRIRDRIFTDFNKWTYSKGFDIRMLENEGVTNNIPYDMPIDDKHLAYRQTLEQMNEAAQTGITRAELSDHLSELYERLTAEERRIVVDAGLSKFLPTESGKKNKGTDFWETAADSIGTDGILPR